MNPWSLPSTSVRQNEGEDGVEEKGRVGKGKDQRVAQVGFLAGWLLAEGQFNQKGSWLLPQPTSHAQIRFRVRSTYNLQITFIQYKV